MPYTLAVLKYKVLTLCCLWYCFLNAQDLPISKSDYFKIRVVDSETGKGVPMVGLIPLSRQKYYTDSNGLIVFYEPGLMGGTVYFEVDSEGYRYPMGDDGRRAVSLNCVAGDSAIVEMVRTSVAERLYRSTGLGIYRDSYLLGEEVPIKKPLLNAQILGQDSNLGTLYKDKAFWIWGDSFLPPEYHGNFSVAAATTLLPKNGGLDPEIGMNYNYIMDDTGAAKPMIQLESPGYVWFDWLLNIKGKNGKEQLVAKYANVNSFFQNYERGVSVFNPEREVFEPYRAVEEWMPDLHSCEHPFKGTVDGREYIFLTAEFKFQRVAPELDSLSNPSAYENFTCLKQGTKFDMENLQLDRNERGDLVYGWKKDTDPINFFRQGKLVESGKIKQREAWVQLEDVETGEKINVSKGSIFFNEYRQKWVLINGAVDIWYAEADTPLGPWVYARKVADHRSFLYNPVHHPFLDKKGGAELFFEGTFTKFFSEEEKVPYYDYNQMFYKLSLEDVQTYLPSPVYRIGGSYFLKEGMPISTDASGIDEIPFFALSWNRKMEGLIPVYSDKNENGLSLVKNREEPLFYALPPGKDEQKPFLGSWETKIHFEAFNNSFVMGIAEKTGQLTITSNKPEFQLSESVVEQDTLKLTVSHPEGKYFLKATASAGNLKGNWHKKDSDYKGTWEGTLRSKPKWWAQYSPSVVNLYEYRNKGTGNIRYSTNPNFKASGFTKTEKPLCRVWKNPSKNIILDLGIKPVKQPSIYK